MQTVLEQLVENVASRNIWMVMTCVLIHVILVELDGCDIFSCIQVKLGGCIFKYFEMKKTLLILTLIYLLVYRKFIW
jgi:hypothetical protein